MTKIIRSDQRAFNDIGWLQTYWLFSFAEYYDPENVRHGKLRVFNDDYIKPKTGFPMHPHEEMEIITIVLEGEISHEDTMGNKGVVKAGDVQRMSAGTGLMHSEHNMSDEDLKLYQIWIYPDEKGLDPSYEQKKFEPEEFIDRLLPVASGQMKDNPVTIHTDATIYRSKLSEGKRLEFNTKEDRKLFVYVTSGSLKVNGDYLEARDQFRTESLTELSFVAEKETDFILIDVP
jgi:redox-sensitive bicupin YhaK (pirin superfamily)